MGMGRAFGASGDGGVLFPGVETPGCDGARLWRWWAGTGPGRLPVAVDWWHGLWGRGPKATPFPGEFTSLNFNT
jgi:hypothetical protein